MSWEGNGLRWPYAWLSMSCAVHGLGCIWAWHRLGLQWADLVISLAIATVWAGHGKGCPSVGLAIF